MRKLLCWLGIHKFKLWYTMGIFDALICPYCHQLSYKFRLKDWEYLK
jgi:hypothetical protein